MAVSSDEPVGRARSAGYTLAVVCIGYAMVIIDTTIVNVALPAVQADIGGGLAALQWVVDGYFLVLASLLLASGTLVDRLGTTRVFCAGTGLFVLASALCGVAGTIGVLVAARLLQGVGAALLVPSSVALIAQVYPDAASRARAIALWAAVAGSPQAFGPVLGGFLVATAGWRSAFLINVPIGGLALLLASRSWLPPTRRVRPAALDVLGQVTAALALGTLTFALIEGNAEGWTAPAPLAAALLFAPCAAAFVVTQSRGAQPMLPRDVIRASRLPTYVVVGLLLFAAYYGLVFSLNLYLQQVRHASALATGLSFLPSAIPIFAMPPLAGRATPRLGAVPIIAVGLGVAAVGALGLSLIAPEPLSLPLSLVLVVIGCGVGITVVPQTILVMATAPAHASGIASGMLNAGRQFGSVLGVAVLGGLAGGAPRRLEGLRWTALLAVLIFSAGLVLMLRSAAALRLVAQVRSHSRE